MIIAIDGPAGAGKSTVAKLLAKKLGFLYVDTGAMYRALTLKILGTGLGFENVSALIDLAGKTVIKLKKGSDDQTVVLLDGEDVSARIRAPEITNEVFRVARIPEIRQIMLHWQRDFSQASSIVMEGRDIGTVVFPRADRKFYLDASAEIRGRRRYLEFKKKGVNVNEPEIIRDIKERDNKDKNRSCAPLKQADDAVYVDSSNLNVEQVVELMFKKIKNGKN